MTRNPFKTWASGIAIIAGSLFIALAVLEKYVPSIARAFDADAARLFTEFQEYEWAQAFVSITSLGNAVPVIAITAGALYFLRNSRHAAARLVLAVAGSSLTVELVKLWVSRARPDIQLWIDTLTTYSFPSGHATSAMALYGSLGVIAYLGAKRDSFRRTVLLTLAGVLVLGIGLSRLVLGAHFLSDVLGGYLLGIAWIAIAYACIPRRR